MNGSSAEVSCHLVSATPLVLIAAADVWFFGSFGGQLNAAALVVQFAVLAAAALIMIPHTVVRIVCTLLLFSASILGAMTIGLFYIPAVCAAAGLTIYQSRAAQQESRR
jgi:hypothetical protein